MKNVDPRQLNVQTSTRRSKSSRKRKSQLALPGEMPSPTERRNALVRRRIKFVVEKGAMARLFRKGSHRELQGELFRRIDLIRLTSIGSQKEYDDWLKQNIKLDCWKHYCSDAIERVRWAYFAKLLNIVIYEIVSNHELVSESDWNNLKNFLHLPIDKIVQNGAGWGQA